MVPRQQPQAAAARRELAQIFDFSRLAAVLQELFAAQLEDCGVEPLDRAEGLRPDGLRSEGLRSLGADVQFRTGELCLWVSLQPSLATLMLTRVMGSPTPLQRAQPLSDVLAGAFHALADEVAARLVRGEPLSPGADLNPPVSPIWQADFWLRVDGVSYRGRAALSGQLSAPAAAVNLAATELPVRLALVLATSLCSRADLDGLQLGDALVPDTWSVDSELQGEGVLCAPQLESGIQVKVSRDQLTVVGPKPLSHEPELDQSESPQRKAAVETSDNDTSHDAVADAPVLIRVEVGSVTMSARQWVELAPGDVIGLGGPLNPRVTLRVAGQQIAQGELVNIDGELGVRVTKLK